MRLPYQVHPGRGPHLLLVHGFLTGPAQWQPNLGGLGAHCTPVTVSLWGHAGAPSPADPDAYHPDRYVAEFESIRTELGAERWFVLGYSLGAGLTLRYAIDHPEQVLAHAFTNSTSGLADTDQQQAWRAGAADSAAAIRAGGLAAMERIPVHPRHARRLPAPVYRALCDDAVRHDPTGIAGTLEHTNPHASVRGRVGDNVRPALLLCGTRERRFRPHRDFAASAMPLLDIVDLDAGHGINMETPQAFNEALVRFMRSWATS
ncbi:MAG: alpha/beta fold hydrolase [Pseudomonadales bacterium]